MPVQGLEEHAEAAAEHAEANAQHSELAAHQQRQQPLQPYHGPPSATASHLGSAGSAAGSSWKTTTPLTAVRVVTQTSTGETDHPFEPELMFRERLETPSRWQPYLCQIGFCRRPGMHKMQCSNCLLWGCNLNPHTASELMCCVILPYTRGQPRPRRPVCDNCVGDLDGLEWRLVLR